MLTQNIIILTNSLFLKGVSYVGTLYDQSYGLETK